MNKLFVIDLDGTLAESKSSLDDEMSILLTTLLTRVSVAVISVGTWEQFEKQLLSNLSTDSLLSNLVLLPTCGTKFLRYSPAEGWSKIYSEDLSDEEKKTIFESLHRALDASGF